MLTRYLYNKLEVKHSLFVSILEHNIEESLFWGFELYYSGFYIETFEFIFKIYDEIFKSENPSMENYINNCIEDWNEENDPIYFGNLIATLCTRKFDLTNFCKDYFRVKGKQEIYKNSNMNVSLDHEFISQFDNNNSQNIQPRKLLQEKCIYKIRKKYSSLFQTEKPTYDEQLEILNNEHRWLYYASFSPIWEERICYHNGTVDHENKKVVFENDNDLEAFFEIWGYEPDEQNITVKNNCIGEREEKEGSIIDFCKEFDFQVNTKKITTNRLKNTFSHRT
jgi:hypothetical protein